MSDNLLQALDNVQASLAALDLADGVGTAHETLQSVNANIDAIRLSIDTRSAAEVVAQNTNFTDLITAISALACSPTVNNYITVQGGSCCGSTGCEPPSSSGTEGDDPPGDGWTDPPGAPEAPGYPGTSAYYDRKCKMANAIHENIRGLISELNNAGLSGLTMPLLIIAITTLVGEISTPVPLLDGVIGVVVGMVASIALAYWTWKEGLDLAQLLLDLDANEQDLVCALYNSSNGNDALTAYLDTLDTYGTSAANLALLETVVVIDLVNRLYFAKDAGEEAALESYTGTVDCSGCGTCQWTVITGSGTILTDNTPFVISSAENAEGNQDIIIGLLPQHCSCAYTIEVVSWTSTPDNGFGVWDCNGVRVETRSEPIVGSWDNASWLGQTEESTTPFTMTLKIRLT